MQKMGCFWVVREHSRSWAMPPFDRAHTTCYSTSREPMRLSCTVFEIKPAICRKSSILTHPTPCIWRPHRRIFRRSLAPDPCTKFEVSSVSRCGDITRGVNSTTGHRTLTTPLSGKIFHRQGGTSYGKLKYQI